MLNSYLNGMLDDVRLWSVARSKADIISGMFGVPDTSPGLEGWWQFDRANSEGIIKDFSVGSAQRDGNPSGIAFLFRPAVIPSTVPCDRASLFSQKQLSSGTWQLIGITNSELVPAARHSHTSVSTSTSRFIIHGMLVDIQSPYFSCRFRVDGCEIFRRYLGGVENTF
jgi:hypothetical protein